MEVQKNVKTIASVALLLLGVLLIFGNLSGNLGFTEGTANYNSSEEVITDVTSGVTNLTDKFGTIFTLLGVIMLIGAIVWMLKLFGLGQNNGSKGVFSN